MTKARLLLKEIFGRHCAKMEHLSLTRSPLSLCTNDVY